MNIWQELRRRRIFRLTGLYIVGAWLVLQVAATFFPAWDIPDTALRYLIIAAIIGFPLAMVFGWFFDLTPAGIARTRPAAAGETVDYSLKPTDYVILLALAGISVAILYGSFEMVRETTTDHVAASQKLANSIAVLPFDNLSEDPDTEYFSNGVTEEVLHRLAGFKDLRVRGRASSFVFKEGDMTVAQMSNLLGVRYLLQGSVRRDADHVRVTARLVDESGFQVWSDAFDRKLEGIFSIQGDIANTVASQLVAQIVPRDVNPSSTTSEIEAYTQYLIGRDYFVKRPPNWRDGATEAYEKAIALDPDFAPPYAGLAIATGIGYGAGPDPTRSAERLADAFRDARRALELDPELALGHAALGLLLQFGHEPNFPASEQALRRAIELDPILYSAYNWLHITIGSQGRYEEARRIKEQALEMDPLNPILNVNMAGEYHAEGDFHKAEELLLRQLELPNPSGTTYWSLIGLYKNFGRLVAADEWAKEVQRVKGDRPIHLSFHYRDLGMHEEADYWFEVSHVNEPDSLRRLVNWSYALKVRGDYEEMRRLKLQFERDNPVEPSKLPVFISLVWAAMSTLTGDHATGVELYEQLIDPDKPLTTTEGGGLDAIEFMHMLVYAYRQNGQAAEADALLEKAAGHLQSVDERRRTHSSDFYEQKALNYTMRGDYEGAVAAFEKAVDMGWRKYPFIEHDPRWRLLLDQPAAQSLIALVKADLDRQRERIKEIAAKDDFRAFFEQQQMQKLSESSRP